MLQQCNVLQKKKTDMKIGQCETFKLLNFSFTCHLKTRRFEHYLRYPSQFPIKDSNIVYLSYISLKLRLVQVYLFITCLPMYLLLLLFVSASNMRSIHSILMQFIGQCCNEAPGQKMD